MGNDKYFKVLTRRNLADIAHAAMEQLNEGQRETALLIRGDILDFSFSQRTTFTCGEDHVVL